MTSSILDPCRVPLVLAGSTLGPESDGVVAAALAVARSRGGRVLAVHALEPPPVPLGTMGFFFAAGSLVQRATAELHEQLDRVGARPAEVAGVDAVIGSAGTVLLTTADRHAADLLVVAPRAADALPLAHFGSTVRYLLRHAARPVLVIREGLRMPPQRVLAPLDLSLLSADALRCGLATLGIDRAGRQPEILAFHVAGLAREDDGLRAHSALTSFLEDHLGDYDGRVRAEVRDGDPVTRILGACECHRPDLVVLGTHGRSGWQRVRLGSVAEAVLERATESVLVVPALAAVERALADSVHATAIVAY